VSIDLTTLKLLIRLRQRFPGDAPRRLLALGYPDALVAPENYERVLGPDKAANLKWREDSESVLRWHGLHGKLNRIVDSHSLFAVCGYDLDCIDISAARGDEIIADMNHALPSELEGQFDVVYDGGTLEHCFNIAQAIKNMALACKVGGFCVNINPLNVYNHGFYNFSPTFYADFYGCNGFQLTDLVALSGNYGTLDSPQSMRLPPLKRFDQAPERAVIMAVAQKVEQAPIAWPIQAKYRLNPNLRG
jgi:SAM-dependent methyltransferase